MDLLEYVFLEGGKYYGAGKRKKKLAQARTKYHKFLQVSRTSGGIKNKPEYGTTKVKIK